MSEVLRYDEGPARRVHALAETQEMREQRRRVVELLAPLPGEQVLDVGCGPGHLTRELAAAVGERGRACGVDVSAQMLALADGEGIELVRGEGDALPFSECSFDAAVATQAYEFVERLPRALGELQRVLRPGGRAVILDTDWDAIVWHSSDAQRMGRVLDGWRRRVADPHLPRTLARQLRDAGLEVRSREAYVILDTTCERGSYSELQIEHLAASGLGVEDSELREWASDLRELAGQGEYFFSLNRFLFLAAKPAASEER